MAGEDFMALSDKEIAGCISDIGINFSIQDLQKPNPQLIQKTFEYFAEILMNTTRDVVAPAMRAAAEDCCQHLPNPSDADRLFTADTRDLVGFFVTCRRLLAECGIMDFSFQDLYKPEHKRLVRLFSYIINFIRFRETQTAVIDEHFNKSERTKMRVEELYQSNQMKQDQLVQLEGQKKIKEEQLAKREDKAAALKNRLLELKGEQERITSQLEREKGEANSLKKVFEDKQAAAISARQEAEKLRPYTTQSPGALEAQLRDLGDRLAQDKQTIEVLERRSRALQTSADTFATVTADVQATSRMLSDLGEDLRKEEDEAAKATRHRDALSERSRNVQDVERQERLLQKQLSNIQARTDKLRKGAEERSEVTSKRMEELRGLYKGLQDERAERGKEMERRRVRIEQTEKKMADLKENIENEVHAAHDEYLKMESHVKLYITEMDQCIM